MSDLKKALESRFGEHRVLEAPIKEGEMPLLILDLELKSPVTVVVTNGLSDYKMPVPEKFIGYEHNEIYFCLPSYWEWEDAKNPNMNWVFDWIQKLAKHVVEKETWFGHGHTLPCGKEENALSSTMKQNHLFLSYPLLLEQEMDSLMLNGKEVNFLAITPLFKEEFEYKQARGTFKFMQKLNNNGITEKLDDFRGSIMKRKWRLRRR